MLRDERTGKRTEGWLLNYLPEIYQSVEFMQSVQNVEFMSGFLSIFESIWESFDWQISHLDSYFDPDLAPARFLPWLSTWVGLVLDEYLSEKQQRELLGKAMWLYERQGTAAALREMLRICVNAKQIDVQNHQDNGQIEPYHFRVIIHMPDNSTADPQERKRIGERVKRIVEAEKPAYACYDWVQADVKWPSILG